MVSPEVLATDLDGTLFYPKRKRNLIPAKSINFLKHYIEDGGRLLIVSGRGHYFADKVREVLGCPVDVVGCNGSFVESDGTLIKENFFDAEKLKKTLSEIRREQRLMFISLFCKDYNFVVDISMLNFFPRVGYRLYELSQGAYREKATKSEKIFYEQLEKGQVYKVLLFVGPSKKSIRRSEELTKLLAVRYPDMEFAFSNQVIEITPKGCTKSSGISFYLDYNHFSNDNVIVIGDSGNDISMFKAYHDQSYCMSHAQLSVRQYAKTTIKHFYDLEEYIYPSAETKTSKEKK